LGGGVPTSKGAREGMGKGKEGDGKEERKGKGGKERAGRQGERRERRGRERKEGRGEENFTLPPCALASVPTLPPSRKKLAPPMSTLSTCSRK